MGNTKAQAGERLVKVDPHSIQDALRLFFQPTKTGDLRTDFYSAYQKEAAEYDAHFVKQCDEDLNTTLIFAGLFSAVCSAFVIDMRGKLEPDPIDASTAYLKAILKTLQTPGSTSGDSPAIPTWTGPSPTDVTVSVLLHTSLSTTLLAAFLAMLGKQWLNRYTRHQGGSAAERCEDRQRKLNGLQRWPFRIIIESLPILLQFSLLLLGAALSRFLWDVNRVVASVVAGFTAYGICFYACIVIAGTLSYECPFQTPLSLILRSLGATALTDKLFSAFFRGSEGSNPDADCIFWTLDLITDPEVTTAALRHLTNIGWHYNPSEKVPLPQVARIYMKCFDSGFRILTESRDMAYAAGRALVQLYIHRLCSNMDSEYAHQTVTDAFDHLSSGKNDDQLRSLSLIVKSILEPDWSTGCQWEMTNFDLPWISELWMYYAWFCRNRVKEVRSGGVIIHCNILAPVSKLFENEESPPPSVVRNILHGLLAGVSSSVPPLGDLINPKRNGSTSRLFRRLEGELIELVDHKLWVLQATLQPLVSWKHNRMEVVELCCNLLKLVMEKHTPEVVLARQLVFLLCRIAFRNQIPGIKARADLLDPVTLRKLTAFVRDSNPEFINDLMLAFTSISWDEHTQDHVIWTALDIPAASLSSTSQSALITLFGTARWSLVERLHRKKLVEFVGKLPTEMVVQRIVNDELVCAGWMRLLLFATFRIPNQLDTPYAMWLILLSAFPELPQLFSRDLRDHLEPSETSLFDFYQHRSDNLPTTKEEKEKEVSLWMKLFWSSRFFELDCKSWFTFEDSTVRLGKQRAPLLLQLDRLCFSSEKGLKGDFNVRVTRARMEMDKVRQRVGLIGLPQNLGPSEPPTSTATQKQNTEDAERTDLPQPQQVTLKDICPSDDPSPPLSQSPKPPKIAPQDTPQFNPAAPRRQNSMTNVQLDLARDPPPEGLLPPSPVQRTPPPSPPLSIQERSEPPTPTDSDHQPQLPIQIRSREFLAVVPPSKPPPGGAVPLASPNAGNSGGGGPPRLSFQMGHHEGPFGSR